jgi:polysaccharide export outer membrane protein
MMGIDPGAMDSLIAAKKASQAQQKTKGKSRAPASESQILDSLLSGPVQPDSGWTEGADSIGLDSLGRKQRTKKPPPKRYEQRIFQYLDRSVFSSASGSAGREYVLGPGDEVTVSLWGDKEKEYLLNLNHEGKIFLEGVGLVGLAGQNLDGAQQTLKVRLAKVYSGINRGTTHLDVSLGKTGPIRVFVLGEVKTPGGFVFSGHSSVLSAVYYAKGPTDIGTVRNMQLTRSGKKHPIDLYKYLIHGESLTPNALQDGDILFSGRAEALVEITGDVGRPATYELKKGEGIKELIEFAGGLNATAAAQKLTLQRVFPDGKYDYIDLSSPQEYLSGKIKSELRDGDKVLVEKSSEISRNFITVTGPVKYPGTYEATGVTSVVQLVAKAGGLREDAFLSRVHIVRYKPEGSSQLFAYSLDNTLMDSISLLPRDNVILYSVKDMYIPDTVEVSGAVFEPGKYEFREGMTVQDLIMQSGGLLPHHEAGRALVFRGSEREHVVEQITLKSSASGVGLEANFRLSPNDFVQIPVDPRWYKKEIVSIEGLVMHPGKMALLYPGEKLASVVARAGGFKPSAYIEGGRFFRSKDSVGRVGVNLGKAMVSPKSKSNIPMVGGDSLFVPERLNTVKVIGEVGFETSVLLKDGADYQYYITKAGGFTRRSEKSRVVVQYASGETSSGGFFDRKPDAGSIIYVPQGPEPKQYDLVTGVNTLLTTLGAILVLVISIQSISR